MRKKFSQRSQQEIACTIHIYANTCIHPQKKSDKETAKAGTALSRAAYPATIVDVEQNNVSSLGAYKSLNAKIVARCLTVPCFGLLRRDHLTRRLCWQAGIVPGPTRGTCRSWPKDRRTARSPATGRSPCNIVDHKQ